MVSHVLRKNDAVKNNLVNVTETKSKRSAITVFQQYRRHKTYDSCLDLLRARNTEICKKKNGKMFGELIQYFIIDGDESYFMASLIGDIINT